MNDFKKLGLASVVLMITTAAMAQDFDPVHLGQLQIKQHDLGLEIDIAAFISTGAEQEIQRRPAVFQMDEMVREIALLEGENRELRVVRIVFYQEYFEGGVHQV